MMITIVRYMRHSDGVQTHRHFLAHTVVPIYLTVSTLAFLFSVFSSSQSMKISPGITMLVTSSFTLPYHLPTYMPGAQSINQFQRQPTFSVLGDQNACDEHILKVHGAGYTILSKHTWPTESASMPLTSPVEGAFSRGCLGA